MSQLAYIAFSLALPWIWGATISAWYARQDRRPAIKDAPPPTDYSI